MIPFKTVLAQVKEFEADFRNLGTGIELKFKADGT